jgi:hypothetical protein
MDNFDGLILSLFHVEARLHDEADDVVDCRSKARLIEGRCAAHSDCTVDSG